MVIFLLVGLGGGIVSRETSDSSTTAIMDKDYEIRANFEKNKYHYTIHFNLTLLIGEAKSYIVVNSNLLRGFLYHY